MSLCLVDCLKRTVEEMEAFGGPPYLSPAAPFAPEGLGRRRWGNLR